jgi:hypothetical protein
MPLPEEKAAANEFTSCGTVEERCTSVAEVEQLLQTPPERRNRLQVENYQLSLQFRFLLACHYRRALDIARRFLRLPSSQTIYSHSSRRFLSVEVNLSSIERIHAQIKRSMEVTGPCSEHIA